MSGDLLSFVNLLRFIREFARSNNICEYSYFEFGVLNGESIISAIRQLRGGLSKVYGFDTFHGIPIHDKNDLDDRNLAPQLSHGSFRGGARVEVENWILKNTDFPSKDLLLVEGDFRSSLVGHTYDTDSIFPLIFNVDCDIYSSSKSAFEWIAENAADGSWLLCDDYWLFRGNPNYGQRKALKDVFSNHRRVKLSHYSNYQGYSKAFIINTV